MDTGQRSGNYVSYVVIVPNLTSFNFELECRYGVQRVDTSQPTCQAAKDCADSRLPPQYCQVMTF